MPRNQNNCKFMCIFLPFLAAAAGLLAVLLHPAVPAAVTGPSGATCMFVHTRYWQIEMHDFSYISANELFIGRLTNQISTNVSPITEALPQCHAWLVILVNFDSQKYFSFSNIILSENVSM